MTKDYKNYTLNDYRKKINSIIKANKGAKSQKIREAVVNMYNGYDGLLMNINERANDTESGDLEQFNYYRETLKQLYNWVLSGKTTGDKNYYVGRKYFDTPTEIGENMATNSKIYQGDGNYYTSKPLTPTKKELQNNGYIARAYRGLKEARSLKGNRFKKSRAIHDAKDNLKDIIISSRGIDEFNRTDNIVTPPTEITNTPNFDSPDYIKFLLKTDIREIQAEKVREDKIDIDHALGHKDQILKDLEKGYTETETADRNNCSIYQVSRHLTHTTNRLLKLFN